MGAILPEPFLIGFSDRFGEGLLRSVIGRLGGDNDGELVTVQARPAEAYPVTLMAVAEAQVQRHQRAAGDPVGLSGDARDSQLASVAASESHDGNGEAAAGPALPEAAAGPALPEAAAARNGSRPTNSSPD